MPKLVRLYIASVAIGFAISALFVAAIIGFDIGGLRHLVQGESGVLAVFLLWFFNGIVFSGVQFAYAIMRMAERPQPPRGGRPVRMTGEPVRVKVAAKAPVRRERR